MSSSMLTLKPSPSPLRAPGHCRAGGVTAPRAVRHVQRDREHIRPAIEALLCRCHGGRPSRQRRRGRSRALEPARQRASRERGSRTRPPGRAAHGDRVAARARRRFASGRRRTGRPVMVPAAARAAHDLETTCVVFVKRPPPARLRSIAGTRSRARPRARRARQPARVPAHVRGDRAALEHGLHVEDALDVLGVSSVRRAAPAPRCRRGRSRFRARAPARPRTRRWQPRSSCVPYLAPRPLEATWPS